MEKETEDSENNEVLANRFWLILKVNPCQRTKQVIYDWPSIKWTWWYVTKSRLDVQFITKIFLVMVFGQQTKEKAYD